MIRTVSLRLDCSSFLLHDEPEMRYKRIRMEHLYLKKLVRSFPEGWLVLPWPHKQESVDVMIVRPYGNIFLVSNKSMSVQRKNKTWRTCA